jgi:hypothetical protein
MRLASHFVPVAALAAIIAAGSGFAADLPKEGSYDFTACWSGASSPIQFSNAQTASSFEMTGTIRSNPPGGIFDKETFRCVGMNYALPGKNGGTTVCEAVGASAGDKRLTFFSITDGKVVREHIAGTGKYEGLTTSGMVEPLGPFPVIKAGTFQDCNHQKGTYKMK